MRPKPSFLDRLVSAAGEGVTELGEFMPFQERAVYLAMVEKALDILLEGDTDKAVVVADAYTAGYFGKFHQLSLSTAQTYVYGPAAKKPAPTMSFMPFNDIVSPDDQVFIALSGQMALALVGAADESGQASAGSHFRGIWSVDPAFVLNLLPNLTRPDSVLPAKTGFPNGWHPRQVALAMGMMHCYANALTIRHHDIAQDKDDLFSVLDILKAISTKRRAHDILYVFVDQIARVVSSDRCSVVRIWGRLEQGSVMASHEDATLVDREIALNKYPEIREAITRREKIVINDIGSNLLTAPIANSLKSAGFNSLLVIPIVLDDENVGSLLLRAARRSGGFSPREVGFFEIVTEAAANALERAQLFENIQLANERLERLAVTDGLTGVHNHRYFREQLEQEIGRAARYEQPLSCLIMDVDNFKKFNDQFGHLAGDAVLCEIAQRTQQCVRRTDVIARYGGEEFVVIMPQTDLKGGMIQAERLREMIASTPVVLGGGPQTVTVSIGVSLFDKSRMSTGEDIIREADQALYRAKHAGKNRVEGPEYYQP